MTDDALRARLPGPSFPLAEATFCGDCLVVFSSRERACPKCGAAIGLWRLAQVVNEAGGADTGTPPRESAGPDAEQL